MLYLGSQPLGILDRKAFRHMARQASKLWIVRFRGSIIVHDDGQGNKGVSKIKQMPARRNCGAQFCRRLFQLGRRNAASELILLTYKFGGQAGTSGGLITHGARGHGPVESSSD